MPITKITNDGAQCSVIDCIEGATQQTTVATGADTYSECACDAVMSDIISAAAPTMAGLVGVLRDNSNELKQKALEKAVKDFAAEVFKYGAGEGRLTVDVVTKLSEAITAAGDHELATEIERYLIGMQRGTAQTVFMKRLCDKSRQNKKIASDISLTFIGEVLTYTQRDNTSEAWNKLSKMLSEMEGLFGTDTGLIERFSLEGENALGKAKELEEKERTIEAPAQPVIEGRVEDRQSYIAKAEKHIANANKAIANEQNYLAAIYYKGAIVSFEKGGRPDLGLKAGFAIGEKFMSIGEFEAAKEAFQRVGHMAQRLYGSGQKNEFLRKARKAEATADQANRRRLKEIRRGAAGAAGAARSATSVAVERAEERAKAAGKGQEVERDARETEEVRKGPKGPGKIKGR